MLFNGWYGMMQVAVTGVVVYAFLILYLRISGKRTLSKWNAFDFVVTIALGSILATVITSRDVPIAEGLLALGLLILLQFVMTFLSVRSKPVRDSLKSEPRLLFDRGAFSDDAMLSERVTRGEILAAIRGQGIVSLEDVDAVVLETDGTFSVVRPSKNGSRSALEGVGA